MAKRVLSFMILAAIMLLSVASISAQETVTIRWWHIQTIEEQSAVWEQAVADFQEEYPYVEVEFTILENEAFKQQNVTAMQAGDPPDIFQTWGGGPLWAFGNAGLLRDITPELDANDGEWRNSFASEGVLGLFGQNGEQYGVPYNFGPVGIWYNRALMEQAGLDPDNPFTTWDEFVVAIEALQAEGITPIAIGEGEKWPGHFWFAYLALRLGGGEAYAAAGDRSGAFTDEPFVEAYQYIADLVEMGAFQEGFLGMGYQDAASLVGSGQAAMQLMGTWDPSVQVDSCGCDGLGDDLAWTTFPVIEGGAGNPTDIFGGGDGFAVGANAPDEAVALLQYVTSYEIQSISGALWTLPTVVGGEEIVADNAFGAVWLEAMAAAPVTMSFLDQFYPPALGEAVNDTVETVFAGAATPEEAAAALEDAAAFELE